MQRGVIWLGAALLAVAATVLFFCPAAWLAPVVERQTGGRFTLGDAQGNVWRGSAFIGAAASSLDPIVPLLPGRFVWRLSPTALLGVVDAVVENSQVLTQPVRITGSWARWQISPATLSLPAQRLVALGAPLNTIVPQGEMQLSWGVLQLVRQASHVEMTGSTQLDLLDIASLLSPVKPLGAYRLRTDWQGQKAALELTTLKGPLLLNGLGDLESGRWRFSGKAQAAPGQEERLANLLNLLGQRRQDGKSQYIALEFR